MDDSLFSISCTTCQARLKVRSETAIGQILACPKCGSMVQVLPPPGWKAEEKPKQPADEKETSAREGSTVEQTPPPENPKATARKRRLPTAKALGTAASAQAASPPIDATASQLPDTAKPVAAIAAAGAAVDQPYGSTSESPQPMPLTAVALSPTEALWRKWLIMAAAPVAGLVIVVGGWAMWSSRSEPEQPTEPIVESPSEPSTDPTPMPAEDPPEPAPVEFCQRWIPEETRLLLSLRLSDLSGRAVLDQPIFSAGNFWQHTAGRAIAAFGLRPEVIRRVSLASTDLGQWSDNVVAIIELTEDQDTQVLDALGASIDLRLGGTVCRRSNDAAWPHPFALVDRWTIVTGHEKILRRLADRTDEHIDSVPVAQFLKTADFESDAILAVDLAAARLARWRMPGWLLDVWPAGRQPWHTLWSAPVGLGCTWKFAGQGACEIAFVCEGETTANQVSAALDELLPAAKVSLAEEAQAITGKLKDGLLTAEAADRYEVLLQRAQGALATARWEVVDETVWARVDLGSNPSGLAQAASGSSRAIKSNWLAAAREVDQQNHLHLLAGLGGHLKAEGHFPAGAGGGKLLPPETRLSWIATMLPYYDHRDWHRDLHFGYPWNSPKNRPVSERPLASVVNPALGPGSTEAGFPVTHYVGVAGVGADAGTLPAGDPRAGVFAFGRTGKLEDMPDGLSNSIATMGVCDHLGGWAAGGNPTVRALIQRPYVNGPDGFGSGQPDGMLVGMADGSVRFVSDQIDPEVLEQLATVGGREGVTVAVLDPKPPVLPPMPTEEPVDKTATTEEPGTSKPEQPNSAEPNEPGEEPSVAGPKQPTIDVESRLAGPIEGIELPGVPLADAVALMSQLSGAPIAFDLDALATLGVGLEDSVTVQLSQIDLGQALRAVLAECGLVYLAEEGYLLVTGPQSSRSTIRPLDYPVADLSDGGPQSVAELAHLVTTLVAPDSWQSTGGRGNIKPAGGSLVVNQIDAVHRRVALLLGRLRVARGLPLGSNLAAEKLSLTSRVSRAGASLDRTVTANFHEPTSLGRIVDELHARSGARILIDWSALAAEGVSTAVDGTLGVVNQPLWTALGELVRPLGLSVRVVDRNTFEVTTPAALTARLQLEFYVVGDLLREDRTIEQLTEQLKGEVAGGSWDDAGGPGVLHFDRPSECLLVLQSQPVQATLEAVLARLRQADQ